MPLLITLILEFEILNYFAKKKEEHQLQRVPGAGERSSSRGDEGRKGWNILVMKMQRRTVVGGGVGRTCYVTLDLSYD